MRENLKYFVSALSGRSLAIDLAPYGGMLTTAR
jgi:hypothetical protein